MEHAARESKPVILVTSERKDDWWERHHGRCIGPRRKLIAEAARVAKYRALIFETGYFLSESARRRGTAVDARVVAEIRSLGLHRRRVTENSSSDPEPIVERALEKLASNLVDSDDQITSLIAETNACGFWADEVAVTTVGTLDLKEMSIPFEGIIHFSGDQDPDRTWHGDSIFAKISGEVQFDGGDWVIERYEIEAEIEHEEEDYTHDD